MLKIEKLEKHYKDFDLNCTMKVKRGCITGLIGANGAGKSTTFKAALGLIDYDKGSIEILGKAPEKLEPRDREKIGVVLSGAGFSDYLSIRGLIPMLRSMYSRFDEKAFREQCKRFSLPEDKQLKEFSTGMKRKLQVLAAISHEAELLLLDEPTSGLDVLARDQLLGLLREYMEPGDRSVLISSHISADLEGLCDDVYLIDRGRIVFHEETDVLLSDYALLKVTEEQYRKLDRDYILASKREDYGYSCLTGQKRFYLENYPGIAAEKGSIDQVIMMMSGGKEDEGFMD